MTKSETLFQRAVKVMPGGVNSPVRAFGSIGASPKFIKSAEGAYLYDEDGNLERYNIFSTRMLVRCDADGKLYLYDLVRTKKETSKP